MNAVFDVLGVGDAEIWAVLTVETHGCGFLQNRQPQILFERHIFHNLTKGKYDAGNSDISNDQPGGYISGIGEYPRLEKAMALDQINGLQSASWGIGQVMGFNFKTAGYPTIGDMVAAMVKDENAQLLAMANYIKGCSLASVLRRHNWVSFARGYNGEDFKKNDYDTRLAAAYEKSKILLPDLTLRSAQAALLYIGIDPGPIDGFRGRRTRSALIQFQMQSKLPATGELDNQTATKLTTMAFPLRSVTSLPSV
jgi:hypothetical protein